MENLTTAYDSLPSRAGAGYLVDPADAEVPAGFDRVIPVVFACNERYAPYAGVAIQSVLENAGAKNYYRVYVLHAGLEDDTIRLLESVGSAQLSVRCLHVGPLMESKNTELFTSRNLSKETYYRLLIPELFSFYSKIIYLDCDLVVNRDIADILPADMGDRLLAAVHDIMGSWQYNHVMNIMHLDTETYFNNGVTVFNIFQWRAEKTAEKCFAFIKNARPEQLLFHDQDAANVVCRDRIFYLDDAWNYFWQLFVGKPGEYAAYQPRVDRIGENFNILHYAGLLKPWNRPELPLANYFWRYAKNSVFYERIVENMGKNAAEELAKQKAEADKLKKQNARLKRELDSVHKSASFRVGRAVTFLPRKLRGGVKCYQEHGAAYTADRLLMHLRLKK